MSVVSVETKLLWEGERDDIDQIIVTNDEGKSFEFILEGNDMIYINSQKNSSFEFSEEMWEKFVRAIIKMRELD